MNNLTRTFNIHQDKDNDLVVLISDDIGVRKVRIKTNGFVEEEIMTKNILCVAEEDIKAGNYIEINPETGKARTFIA